MFNANQLKVLNSELDSNRIKTREKGNVSLSYIEGFDVIDTANLIFGFGNWSYLISKLEQVSQEQNHNQNYVVCYKAVVKLIVKDENHTKSIFRQDVGFGSGVAKALNDAHENAGKESVTDGLKRALRSFGKQFGNSLYDKSRNQNSSYQANQNQNYNQRPPQNNQQQQQPYQNDNVNRATNSNFKGVGNQQQTRQNQAQTIQQQVQNPNSRNVNQNPNNKQNNSPQQNSFQNNQSFDQYEYQGLYNLGLDIQEQNGFLIIIGDNQYSYRDAIKASNFRFDAKSKTWYKPIESAA